MVDNNCATCPHKRTPDGGHCYMFREEPKFLCMQHPDRKPARAAATGRLSTAIAVGMALFPHPKPHGESAVTDHGCGLGRECWCEEGREVAACKYRQAGTGLQEKS